MGARVDRIRVKATRAFILLILVVGASPSILAQGSLEQQRLELTTPPPAINFGPWRELESDEFTRVFEVSFPSAYVTESPENNIVRVKAFLPTENTRPSPSVVILHYWGATDLKLEEQMARELNTFGVAGVVMVLPYHLSRTPKGARSGELALQADPPKLVASMTQSILDLRRTVDWIQSRTEFEKTKVGLAGTSLGGIVSALAFGIETRFSCASFVLAGADIAGILWNSSRVVAQREELRRKGYTEDKLRAALVAIEPETYLKPDPARSALVIAAKLDTVVPPSNSRKLITLLGSPSTVWLETGHYGGAFVRGRIVQTVVKFFDDSLNGRKFLPPGSIHAPTLRFGLVYSDEKGLQVAASTDVWHADPSGKTFAAVMLTPQGPQGFAGYRTSSGFAFGAVVLPRRTTFGLSWSVAF